MMMMRMTNLARMMNSSDDGGCYSDDDGVLQNSADGKHNFDDLEINKCMKEEDENIWEGRSQLGAIFSPIKLLIVSPYILCNLEDSR